MAYRKGSSQSETPATTEGSVGRRGGFQRPLPAHYNGRCCTLYIFQNILSSSISDGMINQRGTANDESGRGKTRRL